MMSLSACDKKVSSSHFLKGHIVKHLSSHFCFIHRFICLVGYWIRPLICCQLGHKIARWTAGARPWDCIMYDWHPKAELHNCVKFSGLRFRTLGWSSLLTPENKVIFQSLHSGEHTVFEMTFHIFTMTLHARVRCRGQCRQAQGTACSCLLSDGHGHSKRGPALSPVPCCQTTACKFTCSALNTCLNEEGSLSLHCKSLGVPFCGWAAPSPPCIW